MKTILCPSCNAPLTAADRGSGNCQKCGHDLPANLIHFSRRERPTLDESGEGKLGWFCGLLVAGISMLALAGELLEGGTLGILGLVVVLAAMPAAAFLIRPRAA